MRDELLDDPRLSPLRRFGRKLPERFVLERELGAGGFGTVFAARDSAREGALVALKILHEPNPRTLVSFKQEFRGLADMSHPNLVTLYELMTHDRLWFFSMELLDGVDFLSWVRAGAAAPPAQVGLGDEPTAPAPARQPRALDEERLREALRQLYHGISALHDIGVLHRDLKHSNVLVTEQGRVAVLDFGLIAQMPSAQKLRVLERQSERAGSRPFAGTPHYMSPEQAMGESIGPASDWYSFGAMLYEALTGRRPIEGKSPIQVLLRKQSTRPPHVLELAPAAPLDLAELSMGLLELEPEARPGADAIAAQLGAAQDHSAPAHRRAQAPFVGRGAQLAELRGALDALRMSQRAQVVHVCGRSGMGKSSLMRKFLLDVTERHEDVLVLEGRCFENESVPYKALDSLIDMLSHYLDLLGPARQAELLRPDVAALARLFPTLERIPSLEDISELFVTADSQQQRRRAFGALRQILGDLAREHTLILYIDDVQWGDEDSAQLIEHLIRPPEPPPLMLVMAWRDEDRHTSPFLRALLATLAQHQGEMSVHELPVDELAPHEAQELADRLLEAAPEARVHAPRIIREARGHPLFLDELARHVRRGGEFSSSMTGLEEVLSRRIEQLAEPAQRLLEVIAVAASPLRRALAGQLAGVGSREQGALAQLRNELLVRVSGQSVHEELETYHARVREAALQRLAPDELRRLHLALAQALERRPRTDAELIAHHLLGAQEHPRAVPYLVEAAGAARRALAFDRAARLLEQAREYGRWAPEEERRLHIELGQVRGYLGRGAAAARAYLRARELSQARQARQLTRLAAEQLLRGGHYEEGLDLLSGLLEQFDLHIPGGRKRLIAEIAAARARIAWRGTEPARPEEPPSLKALERLQVCWTTAQLLSAIDLKLGAYFGGIHLLESLDLGDPDQASLSLSLEAIHQASTPRGRPRARELLERAEELTDQASDYGYCAGFLHYSKGMSAYLSGRWAGALTHYARAEELLESECEGVVWELDGTRFYQFFCHDIMGQFQHFVEQLPHLLEEACARQDHLYETNWRIWSYRTHLTLDDPDRARRELDRAIDGWSQRGFLIQHFWYLIGAVKTALYQGDLEEAQRQLEEPQAELKRSLLLQNELVALIVDELRARLQLARLACSDRSMWRELRARRAISRTTGQMLDTPHPFAQVRGAMFSAQLAWLEGELRTCLERIEQAEQVAKRHHQLADAHLLQLWRGHLLGATERGRALRRGAYTWLEGHGVAHPTALMRMCLPVTQAPGAIDASRA